jgi:Dolichyl-phosphate-mannose-protein mannosyltransferase
MNASAPTAGSGKRRLAAFAAVAALSGATGFVLVPNAYALDIVTHAGYWCVLAAFLIFTWALLRALGPDLSRVRQAGLRGFDWASTAIVGLGGTILVVHESFGFKIVMDELMLAGTSMNMHFTRTVQTPFRGTNIHGTFAIIEGMMDKRPLFFPFLESIVHDLTGYRPENAFILNVILVFVFLALVNAAGRRLAGRLAGWLGVALFAGLPLLGQNATGGGFELLNLVMIVATFLLAARYVERRDGLSLTALCYSAMLMAQVRYESAVFLLPVVVLIGWVWTRERRVELSLAVFAIPVLMITCALQNRIFDIRASSWQLQSKPGYTRPFSLSYIPDNLAHALGFFFGKPTDQPNSYVLSALGCIALVLLALLLVKRLSRLSEEPPAMAAFFVFSAGFAAHLGLMLCYFWGHFDDPVIRRLSLPTHLWMVLAVLAVLTEFPTPAVVRTLLAVASLGVLTQGVPSMAAHAYNQEYLAGLETAWRRQFIAEHPSKDYLVIDNDSILWVAHQISSTPVLSTSTRRDAIVFFMKNHTFSDIYVFQRFTVDADTGKLTIREGDDLGPDYVLETVKEERLALLTLSRMSRVKEIREGKKVVSGREPDRALPKSPEEIEKERRAYFENFLRMLP